MRKLSFTIIGLFLILIYCSALRAELKPDKKSEEFLSVVRYIITDEETDMYKEYPPFERAEFISKFWSRRDPNPHTVKNEFQEEYFRRIAITNKLFKGGIAGWLQDRGRIYILFGPPDERLTNQGGKPMDPFAQAQEMDPTGADSRLSVGLGEQPSETWVYYKLLATSQVIRIDFVDKYNTGNYRLVTNINQLTTGYIDTFINPSLSLIHELSKQEGQVEKDQNILMRKILFNFQWEFIKERSREKDRNLLIHMEMPYERIIYQQQDDQLMAEMELFIEIRDKKQNLVWDLIKSYPLSFDRSKFQPEKAGKWNIDVPVTHLLPKGKYTVYIHLLNLSVDQDVKKLLKLKM